MKIDICALCLSYISNSFDFNLTNPVVEVGSKAVKDTVRFLVEFNGSTY